MEPANDDLHRQAADIFSKLKTASGEVRGYNERRKHLTATLKPILAEMDERFGAGETVGACASMKDYCKQWRSLGCLTYARVRQILTDTDGNGNRKVKSLDLLKGLLDVLASNQMWLTTEVIEKSLEVAAAIGYGTCIKSVEERAAERTAEKDAAKATKAARVAKNAQSKTHIPYLSGTMCGQRKIGAAAQLGEVPTCKQCRTVSQMAKAGNLAYGKGMSGEKFIAALDFAQVPHGKPSEPAAAETATCEYPFYFLKQFVDPDKMPPEELRRLYEYWRKNRETMHWRRSRYTRCGILVQGNGGENADQDRSTHNASKVTCPNCLVAPVMRTPE